MCFKSLNQKQKKEEIIKFLLENPMQWARVFFIEVYTYKKKENNPRFFLFASIRKIKNKKEGENETKRRDQFQIE